MPLKRNPATGCFDMVNSPGTGVSVIEVAVDDNTAPGTNPVVPDVGGEITISGAVVSAHTIPLETHSRAVNAVNIEIQVGTAIAGAPAGANDAGIVSFDDTIFSVDANGYVSLL